jgi:RNA polymerase sigma factor (sigma-70 family)
MQTQTCAPLASGLVAAAAARPAPQAPRLPASFVAAAASEFKPLANAKPTRFDPELALIRAFQRGDLRAGDSLMRSHQGLVRSIAHGYRLWGVSVEDLMQQGSIGLLKAMQRFDASRTQTLQSYAGYWIRAEIRDYVVRTYRIVRLGTTRTERKALAMQSELQLHLRDRVEGALSLLSTRERRIVEERMMTDEPRTLESLAAELGLSRERVRQLEVAAKAKMKGHLETPAAA